MHGSIRRILGSPIAGAVEDDRLNACVPKDRALIKHDHFFTAEPDIRQIVVRGLLHSGVRVGICERRHTLDEERVLRFRVLAPLPRLFRSVPFLGRYCLFRDERQLLLAVAYRA